MRIRISLLPNTLPGGGGWRGKPGQPEARRAARASDRANTAARAAEGQQQVRLAPSAFEKAAPIVGQRCVCRADVGEGGGAGEPGWVGRVALCRRRLLGGPSRSRASLLLARPTRALLAGRCVSTPL